MSAKKIPAGTPEHREALYQAACAYQNGASLETAARNHHVQPMTLRNYMQRNGWIIHHDRTYTSTGKRVHIPDQLLDAHPRITPRQIADACGVSITVVRERLKARGNYQPLPRGQQDASRWANSLRNRDRILTAVHLADRGLTRGQIAISLNAPPGTVSTWLRKYRAGTYLWQRHTPPPRA